MRGSVDSRNHSDIFFWVVPPQADLRAEAGCVGATVTAPHRRVRCDDAAHDSRSSAPCRNTGRKNAREADSKTRSSHIGAEVKFRIALKISNAPARPTTARDCAARSAPPPPKETTAGGSIGDPSGATGRREEFLARSCGAGAVARVAREMRASSPPGAIRCGPWHRLC